MKKALLILIALLCISAQGAWAQTDVSNESELNAAIADGANIRLTADIALSAYLKIGQNSNQSVTIDLNGHTLSRNLKKVDANGHVIEVFNTGNLTLKGGTLTGGWANNGGGICNYGTATLTNVTITGCRANEGGAIKVNTGATLNLQTGVNITGNISSGVGGGIWSDGTVNVQGFVKVTGNMRESGVSQNVFLKKDKVLTLSGELTSGTVIGVSLESTTGTITGNYDSYHSGADPNTFFQKDVTSLTLGTDNSQAALSIPAGKIYYIERGWNGKAVTTVERVKTSGEYTEITGTNSEWMTLVNNGWYVVKGSNVSRGKLIVPDYSTVHLILCDGANLNSVINYDINGHNGGTLFIYGQAQDTGHLTANGSSGCAGIGGTTDNIGSPGDSRNPGTLTIYGGTITAKGGSYAAGIGGSNDGEGGTVTIYGGNVSAYGGTDAAGIGCGEDGKESGSLTVYGGTVFADGTGWGAGIGAGEDSNGADVKIYGGYVSAWAGEDAGNKNGSAIGSEDGDGHYGSLTIGDNMMVYAGSNASSTSLFKEGERVPACRWRPYCSISPCTHKDASFVISGTTASDTHSLKCPYCKGISEEEHKFVEGVCTVCGAQSTSYTVSFYFPDKTTGKYTVAVQTREVVANASVVLPTSPSEYLPEDATFAGWRVGTTAPLEGESCYISGDETGLLEAGTSYTVTGNITLTARYRSTDIEIVDNADNFDLIYENDGKTAQKVTLKGRTLYKDGKWNTICLPFDVTIAGSPLDGDNVDVRTLTGSSWEGGVLKLTFSTKGSVTTMEAGVPYLIKWDNTDETLSDIEFGNKVISFKTKPVEKEYVSFIGGFSPVNIYQGGDYKLNLYMGADNKLYYPATEGFTINSCRAYFCLMNGLYADANGIHNILGGGAREIVLDFGDDDNTTGIIEAGANSSLFTLHSSLKEAWFTLDGHRLQGKPTTKGVYINNGKKVIIK